MTGIKILGSGKYVPELTVTNEDFTKFIETSDEWISTRTGIKTRHMVSGEPTWYLACEASKKAIENAGIRGEDIGLIILTSITSDFYTPSCACMIQREIGAIGSMAIDINCACSGFAYGFDMAKRYLETDDSLKYALVVSAESLSKVTDFSDRATCVLFGDGAAAVVLEKSEDTLYTSYLGADGNGAKFLMAKNSRKLSPFAENEKVIEDGMPEGNDGYIFQDGKEVYKFATKILPHAVNEACKKIDFDMSQIDVIVPHQANVRIIETAAKNLGLPMEKFYLNLHKYGNTSSASIPLAFCEAVEEGKIKRGDKVCFVGFGAGLTYACAIFEY
ncbi:MAG: ketoacyl-ACP synthase III [Oscillospiraceae bacterium]|nr:ketoacyl-ACP synthase III [Oscillospiraceae bacterium]